ncbi:hypothetical protein [Lacrimispora sp.]|uniref:hypothetical protein n=1 Tax=Lacrimispora sp. TaxID=2719234 RepID=UPI00285C4BA4|nr:hypothetical protein [Lacrimispora sp.]MDR7815159.1 hypothetical protein [Lacrimispora sp.]
MTNFFDFSITLTKVSYSKSRPNTLRFTCYSSGSNGSLFEFDYTGPDIQNETGILLEDIKEQLCVALQTDYGYGPFERKAANNQLKSKALYQFKYNS